MNKNTNIDRLYSLDFLRGLAAVLVVFYHHNHFFEIYKFILPFSPELVFIYKFGWVFVDLFFVISGFIFFYKYQDGINNKLLSFRDYLILRLSRLYPLIVITLFITAGLQYIILSQTGKFSIYENNDLLSFILNLFFLQSGFFNIGFSFNAPSWSLGIEFWLYILFFYYASLVKKGIILPFIIVIVAFSLFYKNFLNVGVLFFGSEFLRGIGSFFLGGITYLIYEKIKKLNSRIINSIVYFSLVFCTSAYLFTSLKYIYPENIFFSTLIKNDFLLFSLVVHPLLLLIFLFFKPIQILSKIKVFNKLGDTSFGIYMWHVPLQLLVLILYRNNILSFVKFESKTFIVTFLTVIIIFSYLSNEFFEKPLQRYYRNKYLSK